MKRSMILDPEDWKQWVWPVPIWDGRVPTISDGFDPDGPGADGHREHLGVDVTFRKLATDSADATLPDTTPHYISPHGTPIIAAGPGKIWRTGRTPMGLFVQVDNGKVGKAGGINTFYQHLDSLARDWKKGDIVRPGDILGTMGFNPSGYQFRHLHFEIWNPLRSHAVDPAPIMRHWRKVKLEGTV